MNKYEVGVGEEFVGVYYADSEEEAIKEARSDHIFDKSGNKITLRDTGCQSRDLLFNMTARKIN